MAAALDPTLEKKEFHNWIKGAISVVFAKEGLSGFVQTEISDFHNDLIKSVIIQNGIAPGTTCASCTTANVITCPTPNFCTKGKRCNKHDKKVPDKTPNVQCRNNLCNGIQALIRNQHRYNQPSWNNSDAKKWCVDAFEVAKCFMPPDGYSGKGSLADTDFNGTISMIINNKRFQNKMTAQLNTQQNICSKAREIVNENIRHSGSNELTDRQLAECIDALRDVLRDSKILLHDQHAQVAVNKLNQLKNNSLTISAGDITRAMEENIRDCLNQQQQEAIQAIKKYLESAQTASIAELEFIKSAALDQIRKTADDKKQELLQLSQQQRTQNDDIVLSGAENKISLFGRLWNKLTFKESRLRSEFKEELIRFYMDNESMIRASPLVEDYTVPLTELYVQPPMSAFVKPNAFGQGSKLLKKTPVRSYREVFLNDANVPYKHIYVEANAGYGKTSFTQKVAMTWCQAHKPNTSLESKFNKVDVDTLKCFDFLVLLHLRDFHGDGTCLLDDLILKFVSMNLAGNERFSKQFIVTMLQTKTCLVICDGLDEWVHPETCARTPGIPHNNCRENCTVLTTTRPWKLSTIGLSLNLVDRHLEISELDDTTSKELKYNAVKLLSETSGKKEPDLSDFDTKVSVKLGIIPFIPYILLQLICIWFDGLGIGKSKCETYSNTIEITLQRGLTKKNVPTLPTENADRNVPTVQKCIRNNRWCNKYADLLIKLGELAFHALFLKMKESRLLIECTTVLKFVTEQELDFCLKVGLLSQTKDSSKVSIKQYKVFFQHKSVQEFMAALFITSEWNNETIKSTIIEVCSSLSSILEMENLFVFVCGMNPKIFASISYELQKIIDSQTRQIWDPIYSFTYSDRYSRTIQSYRLMQLHCLQESIRNENRSCPIPLYVVFNRYLIEDLSALKAVIDLNKGNVKSLRSLDQAKEIATEFIQSLDPGVFTSLETLTVDDYNKEPVWLTHILTESARTLKCLTLSHVRSLSDINITMFKGLTCLQSLYLSDVDITHSNLKYLYTYISQTTTLTQLKLQNIICSGDTYHRDCGDTLNLHRLNELKLLNLNGISCKELHLNPACLETIELTLVHMTSSVTLWDDLREAPVLSSLTISHMTSCQEMVQTIPTLTQLRYLRLMGIAKGDVIPSLKPSMTKLECVELGKGTLSSKAWAELFLCADQQSQLKYIKLEIIDMSDVMPRFSFAMTKLERVELQFVTMSSAAWTELFLSVGQLPQNITVKLCWITMPSEKWKELLLSVGGMPHPVTVELYECRGPSNEEWKTIVEMINSTATLSLLPGLAIYRYYNSASLILRNKTLLQMIVSLAGSEPAPSRRQSLALHSCDATN